MYSKISADPGLLKIRHSHRFVAVVIQILIPFVTQETRAVMLQIMLDSRYKSQIMSDYNDTSTPAPIGSYLLINIPFISILKEMLDNNYSVKHFMSKCQQCKNKLGRLALRGNQAFHYIKMHWVRV